MFLRRGAYGAAGLGLLSSGLLVACSDDKTSTSSGSGAKDFGALNYQLSWVKNSEFSGTYIADDRGYFKDAGFSSVNLISGGPNVQQDAVVQSGKALLGISTPDITASAINKGADLIIIGAQYQKNPFCVMSLAKTPINTPEEMKGKKIGVQAVNEPVWNAFLTANKIDPASITKVTVQFNPEPLTTGEVDGWFSFITNEPNTLKAQGIDTVTFLLNDFNYPLVSETYMVKKSTLSGGDRAKLKAAMIADIKGWRVSVTDATIGAKLAAEKYGKDLKLDAKEQELEVTAETALILTEDTKANGIFTITDKQIEESIATLKLAGVDITKEKLFDLSLLTEIYSENPDLKKSPV